MTVSPAIQSASSPFYPCFWSCFLHIRISFYKILGIPTQCCDVSCCPSSIQVSVPTCPFLHQQVAARFSLLAIPSHSAQAILSCFLQTVSTGQTLPMIFHRQYCCLYIVNKKMYHGLPKYCNCATLQ